MNNDTEERAETHACDLISRSAAIEALYDVFFDGDLKAAYPDKADVVLDVIRKLPSAQPGSKELSFTHKALDTISMQAAITAIQKAYADTEGGTDKCAVWKNVGLTNALHIMQDLPSAQPERKRGRWIRNDNGTYSCSLCHSWIPEEQYYYARFCLYCGADMRGEDDG